MIYNKLWINKYKPKNVNEIYGHKEQIKEIKDWLKDIDNKNKTIIISGSKGIGKKLSIELIFEEYNYITNLIYPNDIKNLRNNNDFNDFYNFSNSIYAKIDLNYKNNKIVIIFAETENITLTNEKKYIIDIYKENNKLKSFPLIFISNNQHSKLLCELKKNCKEIVFKNLTKEDCVNLINKISLNENIKFESTHIIDKLIDFSQNDIRRLINLFEELSYHLNELSNNLITNNLIDTFIAKSRYKNIDIGLFYSTERILNNYLDYETIYNLYEIEKVLLPLMIHENYLKKILTKNVENLNLLQNTIKIADLLSIGENIETSIYTDQNWYLQTIHGFYTCIYTSYYINKISEGSNKINQDNINFSSDLNKTSLKNINRKNINNLLNFINNKTNLEILMLNKLSNYLMETNHEELLNILKNYDKKKIYPNMKNIELCLKIDKTYDFNITNLKKKLSKII
jgi:replication factor C subunit 1